MMDDTNAFERLVASRLRHYAGPTAPVDDAAVYHSVVVATRSPMWSLGSMVGATKVVVAGAIMALLGSSLIIAQYADQRSSVPGAGSDPGTFSPTGSLAQPRAGHTATLLRDGRVLVVGGGSEGSEVWDPATESFSPAGSLAQGRDAHTATLLPDGRVLVVGGSGVCCGPDFWLASAEVWDPDTTTFEAAGSMAQAREGHMATLLPDGRVLILGGFAHSAPLGSAEIWDPETNMFSLVRSPFRPRWSLATMLHEGRVLILDGGAPGLSSAEPPHAANVWDPVTETLSPAGTQTLGEPSSSTLLPDGRVLVLFGEGPTSAATWDPETSTFSLAGTLAQGRKNHLSAALPDGRVLIVGGCFNPHDYCEGGDEVDSAEIWDPSTATFGPAGSLPGMDAATTVTHLPDGRALFVGGWSEGDTLASAMVWESANR